MQCNLWTLVLFLLLSHEALGIQQNVDMNERYFRHLKDMHTYQNYLEEAEGVRQMLHDFRGMPHPEKHRHLDYLQNRPEFQHLSRYFQFAGLLEEKGSLVDTIELLMHLQHSDHIDHESVVFTRPEIHAKAKVPTPLREFLERLQETYDVK